MSICALRAYTTHTHRQTEGGKQGGRDEQSALLELLVRRRVAAKDVAAKEATPGCVGVHLDVIPHQLVDMLRNLEDQVERLAHVHVLRVHRRRVLERPLKEASIIHDALHWTVERRAPLQAVLTQGLVRRLEEELDVVVILALCLEHVEDVLVRVRMRRVAKVKLGGRRDEGRESRRDALQRRQPLRPRAAGGARRASSAARATRRHGRVRPTPRTVSTLLTERIQPLTEARMHLLNANQVGHEALDGAKLLCIVLEDLDKRLEELQRPPEVNAVLVLAIQQLAHHRNRLLLILLCAMKGEVRVVEGNVPRAAGRRLTKVDFGGHMLLFTLDRLRRILRLCEHLLPVELPLPVQLFLQRRGAANTFLQYALLFAAARVLQSSRGHRDRRAAAAARFRARRSLGPAL